MFLRLMGVQPVLFANHRFRIDTLATGHVILGFATDATEVIGAGLAPPKLQLDGVAGVRETARVTRATDAPAKRNPFTRLARVLLWGESVGPPSYVAVRGLFIRMLGVVYGIAFVSFGVQFAGLVGRQGILPVADMLQAVHRRFGDEAYFQFPTLCWLNDSDAFLCVLCWGGAVLAIPVVFGFMPGPFLALLWVSYLSLVTAGQTFLSFQWDILLLETGLLALLFAPWRPKRWCQRPPSRIVLFLLRWLLFRLMLLSGLVKLWAGDGTWTELRALNVHFETQPLPSWTSWYAHHLPDWMLRWGVAGTFVIELALPLLIFAPRRPRFAACIAFLVLMALIAATGNYNFFNLLTVALCVTLLDDAALCPLTPRRWRARFFGRRTFMGFESAPPRPAPCMSHQEADGADSPTTKQQDATGNDDRPNTSGAGFQTAVPAQEVPRSTQAHPTPRMALWRRMMSWAGTAIMTLLAMLIVFQSFVAAEQRLSRCPGFREDVGPIVQEVRARFPKLSSAVASAAERTQIWLWPFKCVNAYGLFQSMTTTRPEIVIEGSADGRTWLAYEFRWKPGDLAVAPRFVQPHQPRLDWQMWFAALSTARNTPWFGRLLARLLDGEPTVLSLFERNPFPDQPPKYVRAMLYRYRFTDSETRQTAGHWWTREPIGIYHQPAMKPTK